jgi:hypothetical protein
MEARWGKVNPHFVGRKAEIKAICRVAQKMSAGQENLPEMYFIWGETGSGKSDFLVQTFAMMRKLLVTTIKRVILSRNVSNEGDELVPFR